MNEIKVFSPASIANLSCGYDILGVCLDNIGDEITVRKTKKKGVVIKKVSGQKLSTDISLNVAGVSATALLNETKVNCGFEIEIHKGIKPGSGIGSSAASSAGMWTCCAPLLELARVKPSRSPMTRTPEDLMPSTILREISRVRSAAHSGS